MFSTCFKALKAMLSKYNDSVLKASRQLWLSCWREELLLFNKQTKAERMLSVKRTRSSHQSNMTTPNGKIGDISVEGKNPMENKENDQNPPKRRSARLTRNTKSMAEDDIFQNEAVEEPTKKLPFIRYHGAIKYYTEAREIAEASDYIMQWIEMQTHLEVVPLSFDMEWPFSFQTGPGKSSVLQICVEEKCCYVFHLSNLKKLPPALTVLLNHPKVRPHGVNIKSDFRKLARDFPGVDAEALIEKCIDLGVWYNRVQNFGGRWSLERLANVVVKKGIDKSKKIRMSKWHVVPLDENQLMYAAIDVYIGHIIYQEIEKREKIKIINEQEFLNKNGEAAFKAVKALGETFLYNTDVKAISEAKTENEYETAK